MSAMAAEHDSRQHILTFGLSRNRPFFIVNLRPLVKNKLGSVKSDLVDNLQVFEVRQFHVAVAGISEVHFITKYA